MRQCAVKDAEYQKCQKVGYYTVHCIYSNKMSEITQDSVNPNVNSFLHSSHYQTVMGKYLENIAL